VKESVIISKEIESVIDKENLFGVQTSGSIPLTIWCPSCIIHTDLISANIANSRVKLEFKTRPPLAQDLLANKKVLKILIGSDHGENFVEYTNCEIKSLNVISQGELYLCRIVINFSK
tara:strand:+ start:138 stop:491 length:354 start_codon:yes stop_codon:yes gene_type:complete